MRSTAGWPRNCGRVPNRLRRFRGYPTAPALGMSEFAGQFRAAGRKYMSNPAEAPQNQEPSGQSKPLDYDAFLSYTHRDRAAVSGIQKALHRIGRRLGQLRALRVFRDDTDLMANPDLWGRIVDGLDRSRYLIVTLSPQAAQSHWVNKEVSYWLEHRGRDQLLLVLAEG